MDGKLTLLTLYVDDFIIASDSKSILENTIKSVEEKYKITHQPLSWMLGIKILNEISSITLTQSLYINSILSKFKMEHIKTQKVPMNPNYSKQLRNTKPYNDNTLFRSLLGSLMYLAVQKRPDISFAVSRIACYAHEPLIQDYEALVYLVGYLKNTSQIGIKYNKNVALNFYGYSDSDFAEEITTRRSTTGSIWYLNGSPVSWNSKRQELITTSSTEAELVALDFTFKEGLWLQRLLIKIGLINADHPIKLLVDNQSTIKIVNGSKITQRTKHIDVKYLYAREHITSGNLFVQYVPSLQNLADGLTKPLSAEKLAPLIESMTN
jgi:hypothetical protein